MQYLRVTIERAWQASRTFAQAGFLKQPPGGDWQAFLQPAETDATNSSVRLEFVVPATRADAAAIFLPTNTAVSNVACELR
jgi:hypothetical protein